MNIIYLKNNKTYYTFLTDEEIILSRIRNQTVDDIFEESDQII